MKHLENRLRIIWDKLFILCGSLYVLIPTSPLNMPLTYRDSGLFLYIGWRILNGELPYRDIWDHKPPIIYYINALGLAISNHNRWGVWLIEFVCLFFAGMIIFRLLKRIFGIFPSIFSLLFGWSALTLVMQGGNLTEEYALPLQILTLWVFTKKSPMSSHSFRYWFLIGCLGTIAFFIKQTTIGIWIAILLYLSVSRLRQNKIKLWLKEVSSFFTGCFVVCSVVLFFWGAQGALADFWDASFKYNFIYITENINFIQKLILLWDGITPLTESGLLQFALLGYVLGLILFFFRRETIDPWRSLLLVNLIDLPIEFVLASLSGKFLTHYFISMVPAFIFFSALVFWCILLLLSSWKLSKKNIFAFQFCLIAILIWSSVSHYSVQVSTYKLAGSDRTVIDYIEQNSDPKDHILFWGAEASLNFFTKRESPTRFVYQYPIYNGRYTNEKMIQEFLNDISENHPNFIIDTTNSKTPLFEFPIQTDTINREIKNIKTHYQEVEVLGNWIVYKYIQK